MNTESQFHNHVSIVLVETIPPPMQTQIDEDIESK